MLDDLPQTYAHGDASPQNLLLPADEPGTIASSTGASARCCPSDSTLASCWSASRTPGRPTRPRSPPSTRRSSPPTWPDWRPRTTRSTRRRSGPGIPGLAGGALGTVRDPIRDARASPSPAEQTVAMFAGRIGTHQADARHGRRGYRPVIGRTGATSAKPTGSCCGATKNHRPFRTKKTLTERTVVLPSDQDQSARTCSGRDPACPATPPSTHGPCSRVWHRGYIWVPLSADDALCTERFSRSTAGLALPGGCIALLLRPGGIPFGWPWPGRPAGRGCRSVSVTVVPPAGTQASAAMAAARFPAVRAGTSQGSPRECSDARKRAWAAGG